MNGQPGNRTFDIAAALFAVLSIASAIWPSSTDIPLLTRLAGIAIASVLLCLPFLILWFVGRRLQKPLFRMLALGVMTLLFLFWAWAFLSTFYLAPRPDAQAGLIFVAAPAYMFIAALFAGFVLRIADNWKKIGGSGE
ncbi:hypothetical protein ACLB6G_17735 [Zhengella sp. ZM62]|uniref:hypothetical protein n=1 Tax=Zhengella sedimenti TaxID=3390035 RepID=UPI003974E754